MKKTDPIDEVEGEIKELQRKLQLAKAHKAALEADREKWPKLVKVSVGKGECGEEMVEAFNSACGWTPENESSGPWGWNYLCAQAWFFYEVTKDGRVTLVGARDSNAGSIGKTDVKGKLETKITGWKED